MPIEDLEERLRGKLGVAPSFASLEDRLEALRVVVREIGEQEAPSASHTHLWSDLTDPPLTYPPSPHPHPQADIQGLEAALASKAPLSHTHPWGEVTGKPATFPPAAHQHPASDITGLPQGTGAKALYLPLISHVTTLEETTSAAGVWKVPAATTYGQVAVYYDGGRLTTPVRAELVVVYSNTATSGVNRLGLVFSAAPVAAGTTVVPIASSQVTLANSAVYPQTVVQVLTVGELPTGVRWLQFALNLTSGTIGPNIFSLGLWLYY